MAAGELSAEQARFVAAVASQTGLQPVLLTAWVACETGWEVTKANHNYLNVGPGRHYTSVDAAATDASQLIRNSPRYAGIRGAIAVGPAAVADAIEKSAWGSNGPCIKSVLGQLGGSGAAAVPVAGIPGIDDPGDTGKFKGPAEGIGEAIEGLIEPIFDEALKVGLGLVLAAGGLGIIALGISRLTGVQARQALQVASTATGTGRLAAAAV